MTTRKTADKWLADAASVVAWTAANGIYVGKLVKIDGRPWRGTVKITGIRQPATIVDYTRQYPRRGFRVGEELEVGGASVSLMAEGDWQGHTVYADALDTHISSFRCRLAEIREGVSTLRPVDYQLVARTVSLGDDILAFERGLAPVSPLKCSRCGGSGHFVHMAGKCDICFGCRGKGTTLGRDPYGKVVDNVL